MGGRHGLGSRLYVARSSVVHRLSPQCKLLATFLFVLVVVSTPRESFWAFGVEAGLLAAVALVSRVPVATLLRRLTFELPFVAFAVLLPIIGRGERVEVVGMSLSVSGLWAAWNILIKGTLGVAATRSVDGDHADPVDPARSRAVAPTEGVRRDLRVHGALRRRRSRVSCTGCASPVRPAVTIPGGSGRPGRWHRRPGRCSSVRTSAANASTWRWCRAGTTARCPCCTTTAPADAEWAMALSLPAAAAAVSMTAWLSRDVAGVM